MKNNISVIAAILIILLSGSVYSQSNESVPEITTPEEAREWLLELYTNRDFEFGYIEGNRLIQKFKHVPEVEASQIINKARFNKVNEAIEAAAKLLEEHPENLMAIYAKAVALRWDVERRSEAMDYISLGLEIAPSMSEFQTLHIALLNALNRKDEAFTLFDKYLESTDNPIRVMEMKGFMMNTLMSDRDDINRDDVFRLYAGIRNQDPHNFNAHFFPGIYHLNANQIAEATELLKIAAEISTAPEVHRYYWETVNRNNRFSKEEKTAIIRAGVESLKERRPETSAMFLTFANIFNTLGSKDEQGYYADKILERYNDSADAEWILVQRQRDYRSEHSDRIMEGDAQVIEQYRKMLWGYLERPDYHNRNLKGEVYLNLFMSKGGDDDPDPETLETLLDGLVEYNPMNPLLVYAEAPAVLAEKGGSIERALELAHIGFEKVKEQVDSRKEWGGFSSDEEYQQNLDMVNAVIQSAIGWIYFHAGELENAEEHLSKSHRLSSQNRSNLYRLGQLYERLNQPQNSETYYAMGVGATGMGDNPNEKALKELYEKTRGSLDDYDTFLEQVLADDREIRRERILADKHENPVTALAFELTDINGKKVTSVVMEQKIVAINFWGKWCGPCVAEMPDVQQLYENYRDDDEILILTINNDPDLDDLINWLNVHNYTFPTLRDDGYISSAGVNAFPTTWFLDRNGSIVYTQIGYTSELVEEFTWRLEELRRKH